MKSINCKDVLTKCEYLVKVQQSNTKNGCKISFPKILMFNRDKVEFWETCFELTSTHIEYKLSLNDKVTKANILVPNYAQRMFVDIDITKSCALIKYSTECLEYLDKNGCQKESLLDIVESSDLEKEADFCDIFNQGVRNQFEESYYNKAKEMGLAEGFLVCQKLIGG